MPVNDARVKNDQTLSLDGKMGLLKAGCIVYRVKYRRRANNHWILGTPGTPCVQTNQFGPGSQVYISQKAGEMDGSVIKVISDYLSLLDQ